jgi:hypothetical protein
MGMLDRIKKRHLDGFKDFVQSMETSSGAHRVQIFTAGLLEDPVYMSYVMKNIRTFDDFFKLSSDEIDSVLSTQDQMLTLFAKSLWGSDDSIMMSIESLIPRYMSKLKDELSYLSQVSAQEKDSARTFILKTVRRLQNEEKIFGFSWQLPPQDLFYPKSYRDGNNQILFENGITAAEGDFFKDRRTGLWKHYYDNGKLLAEGEYNDGLKSGHWTFYFSNGNLKAQGKYRLDARHGLWKEWDRKGSLTEIIFEEGVKKES